MNKYSAQVVQEVKMFSLHNSRAFLLLLLLVVFGKFDGTCHNVLVIIQIFLSNLADVNILMSYNHQLKIQQISC